MALIDNAQTAMYAADGLILSYSFFIPLKFIGMLFTEWSGDLLSPRLPSDLYHLQRPLSVVGV